MNQIAALTADGLQPPPMKYEPAPPQSETGSLIALFERLAMNPSLPIDRIEAVMSMHRELKRERARDAFTVAMADLQPQLPTIQQNGRLEIKKQDGTILQSTPYAKWEDINEAIKPLLGQYGFILHFKSLRHTDRVAVTTILRHREGHEETTDVELTLDTSGSKNNTQAVGSTIAYGKRYGAGMLLNITSRAKNERDDDGQGAGNDYKRISDEQVAELRALMAKHGVAEAKFVEFAALDRLEDLNADLLEMARKNISAKKPKGE